MKRFLKSLLLTMMMTLFFGLTTNAAVTSVKITSPTSYASMRIARKSTDRNVQIKATVNTCLLYTSYNAACFWELSSVTYQYFARG